MVASLVFTTVLLSFTSAYTHLVSSSVLCPVGTYADSEACKSCGPRSTTFETGSTSISNCVCDVGNERSATSCTACPIGKYKDFLGDGTCISCATGSTAPGTGSISSLDCVCDAGYEGTGTLCLDCSVGQYKDFQGDGQCRNCSACQNITSGCTATKDAMCSPCSTFDRGTFKGVTVANQGIHNQWSRLYTELDSRGITLTSTSDMHVQRFNPSSVDDSDDPPSPRPTPAGTRHGRTLKSDSAKSNSSLLAGIAILIGSGVCAFGILALICVRLRASIGVEALEYVDCDPELPSAPLNSARAAPDSFEVPSYIVPVLGVHGASIPSEDPEPMDLSESAIPSQPELPDAYPHAMNPNSAEIEREQRFHAQDAGWVPQADWMPMQPLHGLRRAAWEEEDVDLPIAQPIIAEAVGHVEVRAWPRKASLERSFAQSCV
mmetsp:Transcript_48319/g.114551  ORF Transcript_48319/g.114551 Transcript_48319/m.114551 type:complete len:434 (-) Transcript_48319:85-1386(-)